MAESKKKRTTKKVVKKAKARKDAAKEPVEVDEDVSRIDSLAASISGVLKSKSVYKGSNSDQGEPRLFIPSGVPDLDLVLNRDSKGWPCGRIVEVFGASATCKTGMAYALLAEAQKMGGLGILYPTEGNQDDWLAEKYGVDLDQLLVIDDPTTEGIFASFNTAMKEMGKDGLLVAVVDSVAGMTTKDEMKAVEKGEWDRSRAAQARALLISQSLRRIGALIPRTNCILFFVNQVRDNVDADYGKPKPPGGQAVSFYSSVRLRLEMREKVKRKRQGKDRVVAFRLLVTSEKNRLAPPFQEGKIVLDFEKGLLPGDAYTKKDKR